MDALMSKSSDMRYSVESSEESSRDSDVTVTDSDDSAENDSVRVDKNNNVVFRKKYTAPNLEDDSDLQSLDLDKLKVLPKARRFLSMDTDEQSDIFTVKDRLEANCDKGDSSYE